MLRPRLASSMHSPRRIVLLLTSFVCLGYLIRYLPSPTETDFDFSSEHVPRPPRPNYPPFQPPNDVKDDTKEKQVDLGGTEIWSERAKSVTRTFLRAYGAYENFAPFPNDELLPVSSKSIKNFNGWGLTMVDSLDTMWLLGLKDLFHQSLTNVEKIDFAMRPSEYAPFFETVIRYLGGLLSAYALSNEPILLQRAEELGNKLLPAFDTPSGMPRYGVNTESGKTQPSGSMLFAEIASCQMEYKYLAHLANRPDFFQKVDRIMDHLVKTQSTHGMWPTRFNIESGLPIGSHYSIGSWADSSFEYLLKQYLLSGKTEERLAHIYLKAMNGILEKLVFVSPHRNLLYITDANDATPTRRFEHLSCFFPGLLALGAETLPDTIMTDEEREIHKWAAEGLAYTCWIMYADQPSGLGAEIVTFDNDYSVDISKQAWFFHLNKWKEAGQPTAKPPGVGNPDGPIPKGSKGKQDYTLTDDRYLLRPETLESMFILYRTTKDPAWRERGWQIWEAIEAKTRTDVAYANVEGVGTSSPRHQDVMPSYFLAETIKYAYLIASDVDPYPSNKFIFNTEAHPLPVFKWTVEQRQAFQIV
ncbi:hypothetical protein Clacol_006246 [Clathrus columnatus]|uniref:alpha-1,2-Mannosidase n=1 Tax=Clathrus columnatus TaxID=1419009 RepID=A0AAV5AFV4_9AGAM|nr:hypothetical protein Clacol_006246 [Clathrus columnatus]